MGVLGALGNLGKVYNGYQNAEEQAAQVAAQQAKLAAIQAEKQSDAMAAWGLTNDVAGIQRGVQALSPPGAATPVQPQAPGQASVPAQPPPQPPAPPTDGQTYGAALGPNLNAGGPAPPMGNPNAGAPAGIPQGAGPPQAPPPPVQAPPTGQTGPIESTQPQPKAPPLEPYGQMTASSVAQRIMLSPQGRKIDWSQEKNQIALLHAVSKYQQALAPEEKMKVQQLQYDLKVKDIERKAEAAVEHANNEREKAQIRADAQLQVAQMNASARLQGINITVGGQNERAANAETGKNDRAANAEAGKTARQSSMLEERAKEADQRSKDKNLSTEQRAEAARLRDAYQHAALAEKGREADQSETGKNDRNTQNQAGKTAALTEKAREFDISDATKRAASEAKLKTVTEKAKAADISDEDAQFYSDALRTDPAMVMRMMGGGGLGTAAKQKIAKFYAANPNNKPEDIAKADAVMSGNKAALQTAGRQGAKVDIGAEEIKTFGPQVISAAKKMNLSQYPTLNALEQAYKNKTGGPEVTALYDAITNYRNALIQVAQRGGATSEGAQARADKYLNPTMSMQQILAAVNSGQLEAKVAQEAVKSVKKGITDSFGSGQGGAPAFPTPPAGAISDLKADPSPEMRQHFDEIFGPGAAAKAIMR